MKTQYVKITKVPNNSGYWYEGMTGKIFPVISEEHSVYRIMYRKDELFLGIHKAHCVPVYIQEVPYPIGEWIEVSNDKKHWQKRIFAGFLGEKVNYPFIVVFGDDVNAYKKGEEYSTVPYRYAQPIQEKCSELDELRKEAEEAKENLNNILARLKQMEQERMGGVR